MRQQRYVGGPFHGQEKVVHGTDAPEDFLALPVPSPSANPDYAGYQLAEQDARQLVYRFVGTMSHAELDWHGFFVDHPTA